MTALVKAIEQKRFKQAEFLLRHGENVNQQEKHSGTTPLLAVCFLDDENLACRIAKRLLRRGADVSLHDVNGMSPLMQASKLGKEKLVQALIESQECDFAAADSEGNTALIHSIEAGNSRITKAITEAMNVFDVRAADKANKNGETPLIRATKLKRNECKEVLLSDGKASPCARDFTLKLNAKEWELYLNRRKENDESEGKNSGESNCNEKGIQPRTRGKRSTFNSRQDLINTALPLRHSVSFIQQSKPGNIALTRRTKSAPLVKGERGGSLANEKPRFKHKKEEKGVDNWLMPANENSSLPQKPLQDEKNSIQHSVALVTYAGSPDKHVEQLKMEPKGDCAKEGSPRTIGGKKALKNYQSQLHQLFSLMTDQNSNSFRSPAKERSQEKKRSNRAKSAVSREFSKRHSSRRGSMMTQTAAHAQRRWSTAMTAISTSERFSSLYNRSDFQLLDKSVLRSRRGSLRSNPDVLGFTSPVSRTTRKSTVSPNLVKLDPNLSHSLPERRSLARVKSSKPRARLYTRHNSDSLISAGNLLSRFSGVPITKTPVIEEGEEGAAGDC